MNQHDIVTEDGIEILIEEIDQNNSIYKAASESDRFREIFGVSVLDIEGDGEHLEDFVFANVEKRHQDQAFKIIKEILSAI